MEERKATQIGATEVEINLLYGLYIIWSKNDNATQDVFFEFILTPSVDRDLFLDEYCEYDFKDVGESVIIRLKVK